MEEQKKELLKSKIDEAKVVSFDIFDTLLFRKTNTPETIFDLVGKHFGIHGFRKLRMNEQNEASRRAYAAFGYPHADMDQIYEVMAEHTEIPVDWMEVKDFEIQMEHDALVPNQEMLEFFEYAKARGKRVIIVSDMYLLADTLKAILEDKGITGFAHLYCSADEHKAKFNRDLFEHVLKQEQISCEQMLHIGDKARDDGEFPTAYGIQTFVYERQTDLAKVKDALSSDVDKGIYKILCDGSKGFWYDLGVEVGGPIYMGLYRFMLEKAVKTGKKIFFLSRDGYNLYHIFKEQGHSNIEYLYTSRRALTLASITEMNEQEIATLPPYTYGQTVGEVLDYLCIDRKKITKLAEAGLESFEQVMATDEQRDAFRNLYRLEKGVFLERCRLERENALKYYEKIGFLAEDAICFDCGWQGSSQELVDRFLSAVGSPRKHFFLYFGIKNGDKSRKQLQGRHYDTYLFDFYKNFSLQDDMRLNVVLYELFFSAPHESVYYYGENGEVVFETGAGDSEKGAMLTGICDYIRESIGFVEKYDVEFTPEISVGHLKRLIHLPTEEEAVTIGNLQNVDGFARKQGEEKFIAYVTREQLDSNPNIEIYWLNGLLKRPDVAEDIKRECAKRLGVAYPAVVSEYHLEDEQSIRNYHRMVRKEAKRSLVPQTLTYNPRFSVVIPVYNTVTQQLEECFQSVLKQNYRNFELILVDDHSSWDSVRPVLQKYEADDHVRVIYRQENGHISKATNDGIAIADGEFIVFMDCDDTIEPDALYEFAKKLNENPELDFIYSDEDKITEDGKIRHMPFFKPDWSPDLFMNMMYTNHLATYRTSIVREVGGLRTAFNGSQDYDFTLRFMEKSHNKRVGHVPKVLYHWRERKESVAFAMTSKNYASEAARHAKEDYIRRNGLNAYLEPITGMSQYRIVYGVEGEPLVSIIIPSKDHPEILRQCIDSIHNFTNYRNFEILVVDNGSDEDNREIISRYLSSVKAKYIYNAEPFNFSRMCNTGAARASGEYLLFLNDDIEIFQPEWLERMLGHAQRAHIGAVGAKLYYPLSTVLQHTGVSNPQEGPLHSFMRYDDQVPYYFGWNRVDNNCIGVTGACLLLQADKFREVGGFDENLAVAYNDVKLCFALHSKGYYNVVRNDVAAYHYESLSRGSDQIDDRKLIRMNTEMTKLYAQFPDLKRADPFLNENLHQYLAGLDLKVYYDELTQLDPGRCSDTDSAWIDQFNIGDRIQVIGWSAVDGEQHMEDLERYVLFRDPYGKIYGAKTLPYARPDLVAHFGDDRYLYAGFECVLRKSDLRVDVLPYQMGVLTVARDGRKYLKWCRESDVVRNPMPRPVALEDTVLSDFTLHKNTAQVQWWLDECSDAGAYHKVSGFAYKRGKDHYRYGKSLILVDQEGKAREFAVQLMERLDVAYTFPKEHFLYYTGFVCYVYNSMLEQNREYDVIIRLKNRFDPRDIRDIPTGHKIKV